MNAGAPFSLKAQRRLLPFSTLTRLDCYGALGPVGVPLAGARLGRFDVGASGGGRAVRLVPLEPAVADWARIRTGRIRRYFLSAPASIASAVCLNQPADGGRRTVGAGLAGFCRRLACGRRGESPSARAAIRSRQCRRFMTIVGGLAGWAMLAGFRAQGRWTVLTMNAISRRAAFTRVDGPWGDTSWCHFQYPNEQAGHLAAWNQQLQR